MLLFNKSLIVQIYTLSLSQKVMGGSELYKNGEALIFVSTDSRPWSRSEQGWLVINQKSPASAGLLSTRSGSRKLSG